MKRSFKELSVQQETHKLKAKVLFQRLGGFGVACAFVYFLVSQLTDGETFSDSLLNSAALAAFIAIGVVILYLAYALFADTTLGILNDGLHPVVQGTYIFFSLIFVIAFFDFVLTAGTFIIHPAISLIFGNGLAATYWGCETEWIVVEEGSYCREDF